MENQTLLLREQAMRDVIESNPYMKFLGIEILELKEGYGLAKMKHKEELLNPYKTLHGGCLYSMADIVAGSTACMGGRFVTTVSGNLNFLLPAANTDYVYCEAVQLRQGRHLAVFEVKIRDDGGRILDSGEFTFFVTEQEVGVLENNK